MPMYTYLLTYLIFKPAELNPLCKNELEIK